MVIGTDLLSEELIINIQFSDQSIPWNALIVHMRDGGSPNRSRMISTYVLLVEKSQKLIHAVDQKNRFLMLITRLLAWK